MAAPILSTLFFGFVIRIYLFNTPIAKWCAGNNEITTPITSWKRVTEGLSLYNSGISPYAGDIFHETPLILKFFNYTVKKMPGLVDLIFVLTDILTAFVLERSVKFISQYMALQQHKRERQFAKDAEKIKISFDDLMWRRVYVVLAYLFNPYTIATCLAKSTAVFNNLAMAGTLLFSIKARPNRRVAMFCLAIAAYQSLYPVMLLAPAAICFVQNDLGFKFKWTSLIAIKSVARTCGWFALWMSGLLLWSFWIEKSWNFLYSTYGFVLTVPDLTPNVGLFWYFFTEMFEHFRLFFVCVFQINAFIYTVPLSIKLKDHPVFLMYILMSIIAVFKSYPSYGDTTLYIALLPVWYFTFEFQRNSFVIGCMYISTTVLAPILYYLWIYAGSANANFYFAVTLVYNTAQIFLITDILFAFLKREYHLIHGLKPKDYDGKPGVVQLE
ncbi:phosphatidylinositol glycan anchor biosynthesis class U protein [Lingula anatina]|uniref:Phosphatidylinositol glycan anchor biosynthesis class U protein n=1 Tax=Lingula anatina TaxID=7574 RepID=A0A1S3H770_LINAN|nr:phosphatidylinositol glycan anchor biosynthesis class U protein [Lingula anatina]|eukprot:XP_013381827.1 phosphatidylinositol glycan anchor biosynthesis class U protein [Lingula anatina]